MGENRQFPFKTLGIRLRQRREMMHESLAEVSGAVEIDMEMLSKIEQGILQPSEDILLLLVSHLGISENEAEKLWDIAGYDADKPKQSERSIDDQLTKQMFMVIPVDNRALYADGIQVTTTEHGVTFNFMQTGADIEQTVVSRIGMSREHAQQMIEALQQSLTPKVHIPKLLPQPKKTTTDESTKH